MNIGYIVNFKWYPPKSGGSVHAYQLALQLAKRGHSISTIFYDESRAPNLKIYRRRQFLRFLNDIDVLYIRTHGSFGVEKFTLMKTLKLFSLPAIWEINAPLEELLTFGGTFKEIKWLNQKRILFAKLVNAAICVSKELKEYAVETLGIKNSYVVPNGSDCSLFCPEKKEEDIYKDYKECFKVIWTGSARYVWQGIDIILQIAKRMHLIDKKVIFIIITNKKNLTLSNSKTENIIILDEKEYLDLPPYIASADVGLCLYHNNRGYKKFYGSSLKLFDYMASGLPVIATNTGQISEIIKDKRNGILVHDNNVDEIIENILFLKNNPGIAKDFGREGRNAIENYYNWERVAYEIEKVLKNIVKCPR